MIFVSQNSFLVFTAILLSGLLSACSKSRSPAPDAQVLPPPITQVALPASVLSSEGPLKEWFEELTKPTLASHPALKHSCKIRQNASIEFQIPSLDGVVCKSLLHTGGPGDEPFQCLSEQVLSVAIDRPRAQSCRSPEIYRKMAESFRLPQQHALYIQENEHSLVPNQAWNANSIDLPKLKVGVSGDLNQGIAVLELSNYRDWLRGANEAGPLALALRLKKNSEPKLLFNLIRFIGSQREPNLLRLNLSPTVNEALDQVGSKNPERFFYDISAIPEQSPFKEGCTYLRDWLRARQILAASPQGPFTKVEFDCVVYWIDRDPNDLALTVAKVPLPLSLVLRNEQSPKLLFNTLSEALSPTQFQALKNL